MGPYIIIVGYGDGQDMRAPLNVSYACNESCGARYLRAMDFRADETAAEETDYSTPCTYTDGRETGDYPMVSYGYAPGEETPGHEWCPACGALVEHGIGEDFEYFTCNDVECDAPIAVDPDPVMLMHES